MTMTDKDALAILAKFVGTLCVLSAREEYVEARDHIAERLAVAERLEMAVRLAVAKKSFAPDPEQLLRIAAYRSQP